MKFAAAVTSQTHTFSKKTQFIFVPLELQICSESKMMGYKYFKTLKESVQSGRLKTHPSLQKNIPAGPSWLPEAHTHTHVPKLHRTSARKTLTQWKTQSFQRKQSQWAMGKGDLCSLKTKYPAQQTPHAWSWRREKTPSRGVGDRRQN